MKKYFLLSFSVLALALSCSKAPSAEDENAWVKDDSKPVPVLFNGSRNISAQTKAIKDGLISGSVMNTLDVGIVSVAEKDSDGNSVVWSQDIDGTILIDNLSVTTSASGEIVFSPKIYYPFGNKYAYSFYSYYPYYNSDGETSSVQDGTYTITYPLGNTDILWASSVAQDYNGLVGYNAKYCRAVKLDAVENDYFPKLQYKHLLTALVFKVVSKDEDITNYDVKVTGMEVINTSTQATLCVCDSQGMASGTLTGSQDGGRIGFTNLNIAPTYQESELCTILAMPSSNFTAAITLTVDGANKSTVELPIGTADNTTSYDAGYIYYFTITVNNPQEITIMETGLTEWLPGSNPTEGAEI